MFPDELGEDREARREYMEEYFQLAEDKEIAEGDITVSETVSGHEPRPELDDEESLEVLGEDEMAIVSEDEGLGLTDIPDDGEFDDLDDEDDVQ